MQIQHFFEASSGTLCYVVHDGRVGIVIDPVRDYDARSGRTSWRSSELVAAYVDRLGLQVPYVIDTHAHADHMTGLPYFRERYGAARVTGSRVGEVQTRFRDFYHLGADFPTDGSQFDLLIEEGMTLRFGDLSLRALHTPGHTPAHMSWSIADVVFLGDTLFMPDYGAARCDFPGGSASALYDSIQRLYALPAETRLLVCHDYQPGGRALAFESSVAEQARHNVQIRAETTREEFVELREKRDGELPAPALLLAAMQVNIRAGELPEPEGDGRVYLRIPVNALGRADD